MMIEKDKIKSQYEQTTIGLVPKDWDIISLGNVFSFLKSYSYSRNCLNNDSSDIKYIHYGDIHSKFKFPIVDFEKEHHIPSLSNYYHREDFVLLNDGDLVIADASEDYEGIGAVIELKNVKQRKVISGLHTIAIRDNKSITAKQFRVYLLKSERIRRDMKMLATGLSVYGISKANLKKLQLLIPSYEEQRAIANCLITWDNAAEKLLTLIEKKELQKKSLRQQLLTGKKRLKGFNNEWKEYHLGELFKERNETGNVNLPLLSIGQNGVYPQSESTKKDTSNVDKSKYKKICVGDIGYNTMRMWQGRSALSNLEGIVSPAYTVVTPKDTADSKFFAYLFKTSKATNLFWRNSQGLVDDTLNCKYKDFAIVKFVLPEKAEQIAIAAVLQQADKEILLLKTKLDKLKEQKKGLMQVLLTGKKRLKFN